MKTFFTALAIFISLIAFIFCVSAEKREDLSRIYLLASDLPSSEDEFARSPELYAEKAAELCALWQESMKSLTYFVGSELLQSADEAAISLRAAAESGKRDDFFSARLRFIQGVRRIRPLFEISPESVL